MIWPILLVTAGWVPCGILAYGWSFSESMSTHPHSPRWQHCLLAFFCSLLGPVAVATFLLFGEWRSPRYK